MLAGLNLKVLANDFKEIIDFRSSDSPPAKIYSNLRVLSLTCTNADALILAHDPSLAFSQK